MEALSPVVALRESVLAYPLVNAAHIIGIALLFGAIVPLDLRLAGWRRNAVRVDGLSRLLIPVSVSGFILALLSGLLLFATDARAYAGSTLFLAKIALIALALINALALRRVDWRRNSKPRVTIAAALSILLWLIVILLGRMIGYFE